MKLKKIKQAGTIVIVCVAMLGMTACGKKPELNNNLVSNKKEEARIVRLYTPMEKTKPGLDNVARSASEKTVVMAEEKLGVTVDYITYTAENYQDKTYDDVALDRARHDMDDLYLLNPDVIKTLC